MSRPLLIHMAFMALGYIMAVAVATTIFVGALGLAALALNQPSYFPFIGDDTGYINYWLEVPRTTVMGFFITGIFAFPVWSLSALYAEIKGEQRRYWYCGAGAVAGVAAFVTVGLGGNFMSAPLHTLDASLSGLLGGLTYWAIAGRHSGAWKA
jgi:hypothetical protein